MNQMNSNLASRAFFTGLLVLAAACSQIKKADQALDNMDKMKNTTEGMAKTTDDMSATTKRMEKLTDDVKLTSEEMYEDLRQGNSMTIRSERLVALNAAENQMAKISEAGKYFMSFEFQLWKKENMDDEKRWESQKESAAAEFFRELAHYTSDTDDVSVLLDSSNERMNLKALSVAFHRINPNQIRRGEDQGFEPVSLRDLVVESLKLKAELKAGTKTVKDIPSYATEILMNEKAAIYLFQIRHNFLSLMAYAKLGKLTNGSETAQKARVAVRLAKGYAIDLGQFNPVEIDQVSLWAKEVLKVQELLKSLGETPKFDGWLTRLMNNAQIDIKAEGKSQSELQAARELMGLLGKIRSNR